MVKFNTGGELLQLDLTLKGMELSLLTNIRVPEEAMGGIVSADIEKGATNGIFALVKVSAGYCDKMKLK